MDMRTLIVEQTDLARIYAEDGGYNSAARILRELAADVQGHADRVYGEIVAQVGEPAGTQDDADPFNAYGSGPVPTGLREG